MKTSIVPLPPFFCLVALLVLSFSVVGSTRVHASPPANDDLANAQVIPTGSSFSVAGTEIGASSEKFERATDYPYNDLGSTVWYSWTPSISGTLDATATGAPAPYGTGTALFKGPDTPSLATLLTGTSPGVLSLPSCPVTAGQQYFILVGNDGYFHDFILDGKVTPTGTTAPIISVTVKKPEAVRSTGAVGKVLVELSSAPAADLTVAYTISGTAVNGTDYSLLSGSVTVPAGATKAAIKIKPMAGNGGTAKVKLTIASSQGYTVGSPAKGKVQIVD